MALTDACQGWKLVRTEAARTLGWSAGGMYFSSAECCDGHFTTGAQETLQSGPGTS